MALNQESIAQMLKVSRATVSRSLNNVEGIDPQTRGKVLALANRLGYRRSVRGRKPAGDSQALPGLQRLVALVANEGGAFGHGPFADVGARFLTGISEAVRGSNYTSDIRFVEPSALANLYDDASLFPANPRHCPVGFILIYPFLMDFVARLSANYACVSLVNRYEGLSVDCIDANHADAMHQIVQHLSQLGHQRIGFLCRPLSITATWRFARYGGFVQAMARSGLVLDPQAILGMDSTSPMDWGYYCKAVYQGISRGITAWVCSTDREAYELVHDLRGQGISIPRDLSIAGFDGLEPPIGMPALTTMQPPHAEMGIAAVRRLMDRLRNPTTPLRQNLLDCRLIAGQTTSTPKQELVPLN